MNFKAALIGSVTFFCTAQARCGTRDGAAEEAGLENWQLRRDSQEFQVVICRHVDPPAAEILSTHRRWRFVTTRPLALPKHVPPTYEDQLLEDSPRIIG